MSRSAMSMIKGLGTGIAAGVVVGFMGSQMINNDKHMKKKADKAVHAVGDLINDVQYKFK